MLEPHKFYRKFRVTVDWYDDTIKQMHSTRKTMDLGTVQEYEEVVDDRFNDGHHRIFVRYNTNTPPSILRISYDEFDKIFEDFLAQSGKLDARSCKKKLNYNGPVRMYFDKDKQFMVMTMYPRNFSFHNQSYDQVADALLAHIITTFN